MQFCGSCAFHALVVRRNLSEGVAKGLLSWVVVTIELFFCDVAVLVSLVGSPCSWGFSALMDEWQGVYGEWSPFLGDPAALVRFHPWSGFFWAFGFSGFVGSISQTWNWGAILLDLADLMPFFDMSAFLWFFHAVFLWMSRDSLDFFVNGCQHDGAFGSYMWSWVGLPSAICPKGLGDFLWFFSRVMGYTGGIRVVFSLETRFVPRGLFCWHLSDRFLNCTYFPSHYHLFMPWKVSCSTCGRLEDDIMVMKATKAPSF